MPRKPDLPPIEEESDFSIGQRIHKVRKKKGYTQKDLADKIGISRILVWNYENGRLRLYDEMVKRFAIALEVSTDYLLGLKDEPEPLPKK
jgi:transcriptional regulator with XRE-family HTH domain